MTAGRPGLVISLIAALSCLPACTTRRSEPTASQANVSYEMPAPSPKPALSVVESGLSPEVSRVSLPRDAPRNATQPAFGSSMVIRSGMATIEVAALEVAIQRVRQLAERLGGYVGNAATTTGEGQRRSATLQLKIPVARFDEALNGLAFGKVESVNVQAEDVSEEVVDFTARTTNAKRLEERLLALLAAKTGKLEEIVSVERELARVREEIERLDGRLRYLRARVAMSTLTVTVHEPATILPPRVGPSVMGEALRQAWRNAVELVAALVASLGWLIPLAAIATISYLLWRRFGRRRSVTLPAAPATPSV